MRNLHFKLRERRRRREKRTKRTYIIYVKGRAVLRLWHRVIIFLWLRCLCPLCC